MPMILMNQCCKCEKLIRGKEVSVLIAECEYCAGCAAQVIVLLDFKGEVIQ